MNSFRYMVAFTVLTCLLTSCIDDDYFGLSSNKRIKSFDIEGQAGATTINEGDNTVIVPFAEGADVSSVAPSTIEISNLASISPGVGDTQDFTQPVVYTVTAEDGSTANWEVTAVVAEPTPQLENSDFDLWYDAGGYMQPGEDKESSIWDTANKGLSIVGQSNTGPEVVAGTDLSARLRSVRAPLFVRMAAGTLYTGSFTEGFPDPADPRSNIDFGVQFGGRPAAFQVEYRYLPGDEYLDGDGNPLPGSDQADIYVLLERRQGDQVQRIGTGWFRSPERVEDWASIEVPIKYGELSANDPEFSYANILPGQSWGNPQDRPTHITVVFSSSALGDFFTGAIGSELWINNFELVY